jgi:hypothetical protein
MAEGPQPLVRGDKWPSVGSPLGAPGRRRPQECALKNGKQAIRYLQIPLIAGQMERNKDVVG